MGAKPSNRKSSIVSIAILERVTPFRALIFPRQILEGKKHLLLIADDASVRIWYVNARGVSDKCLNTT